MYLTGLSRKNSIMDNALVPDQATDWSISLKPGSYTGDTKLQGNSAEFTFAKSSGIVTKDKEKDWPIVDRRDPSNYPRNNRGSNFFPNKIPFSFLKKRITQLKTALFSWVKGVCILSAFPKTMPNMFRWLLEVAEWGCVQSLKPIVKLDISYHGLSPRVEESLPWAPANISYIPYRNLAFNYTRNKYWARTEYFFDGKVTFPAKPTFLQANSWLAQPGQLG